MKYDRLTKGYKNIDLPSCNYMLIITAPEKSMPGIKDRITRLRKLDDWFRLPARYRGRGLCVRAGRSEPVQAIMKLWLTVSNYKVRYHGDGLITGAITRATFSLRAYVGTRACIPARERKCASSWQAINPDPLRILILLLLCRGISLMRAARALFYMRGG